MFLTIAFTLALAAAPETPKTADLKTAPGFSLATYPKGAESNEVTGPKRITLSELKGKPVVILFWNSKSIHDRTFVNELHKLAQKHSDIVFLAANLKDARGPITEMFARRAYEPHVLLNADAVATSYGVTKTPAFFFIDAEGKIRGNHQGDYVKGSTDVVDGKIVKALK